MKTKKSIKQISTEATTVATPLATTLTTTIISDSENDSTALIIKPVFIGKSSIRFKWSRFGYNSGPGITLSWFTASELEVEGWFDSFIHFISY